MSQSSSKQVMSGLRSVKRDFSSNTLPSSSQDSTSALGEPPRKHAPVKRTTNGLEQRLRDIQAALDEQLASQKSLPSLPPTQTQSSQCSTYSQKRPSPSTTESAAKRRQLPSSWSDASYIQTKSTQSRTSGSSHAISSSAPPTVSASASKSSSVPTKVTLSEEQTHILKLVEEGQSLFYTGSAGTGKSVLLREIIKSLRKRHSRSPDAVAVTASTGIAACNIGGITIHSFAGIGLGIESPEQLATKVRKNKKAMARWLRTKVLIIDEVSMVDGDLFDKLARIGSLLRKRIEPFGNIQVIITGDFFQLPPVTKGASSQVKFAFEAEMWGQTIKNTFNLTKVFRQRDPEFVDMLNEMRFGQLSAKSIAKFKSLSRGIEYEDGVNATELFPRREDVEMSNRSRMGSIKTKEITFFAQDSGPLAGSDQGTKMLSNFMAPKQLTLKLGAQVMLIKNTDETLVNGSMGTVIDFSTAEKFVAIPANEDDFYPTAKPNSKGPGTKESIEKEATAALGQREYPVVEFLVPYHRKVLITPEAWKVELPNGDIQVSRSQLPLILAWAMSIHKSQGQTLERVKVDLAKVFEKGQAYVALSRATSLDGLQVLNFDPTKVNAHPKVVQWTKTLQTISG